MTPPALLISRQQWGAKAPTGPIPLQPMHAGHVYVHHTAGPSTGPVGQVRAAQRHAMTAHITTEGEQPGHNDIDYSFLVDQGGVVYVGRGWGNVPAATLHHNEGSYALCAIGNFDAVDRPSDALLASLAYLIVDGVEGGWLIPDVEVLGHRDVLATACPGRFLYAELPKLRVLVQTILSAHSTPTSPPSQEPPMPVNLTAFVYGDASYANRWLVFGGSPLHIGPALADLLRSQGVTEVLEHNHAQAVKSLLALSGLKAADLVPA